MTVKTLAPYNRDIKTVSRWIKIRFSVKEGNPYFMWGNRRQYLDDVPSVCHPMMYEDKDGSIGVIGGYIVISNCCSVLVEIHPDCEYVRLWEELDNVQ